MGKKSDETLQEKTEESFRLLGELEGFKTGLVSIFEDRRMMNQMRWHCRNVHASLDFINNSLADEIVRRKAKKEPMAYDDLDDTDKD